MNSLPPDLAIVLPLGPTTNTMYVNAKWGGRHKSKRYNAWTKEAGANPLLGNWLRLVEEGTESPAWTWEIRVYGLRKGSDLSNRIKAVEDLVCQMTGLDDSKVLRILAVKEAKEDSGGKGVCVAVQVWIVKEGNDLL